MAKFIVSFRQKWSVIAVMVEKIWEWADEAIQDESDKDLVNALVNAKSAKMKLIGAQYYEIKAITKGQLASMRKTLQLYNAFGGDF